MTISRNLFILTILPTITIFYFSINHILDKYDTLQNNKLLLTSTNFIEKTSDILHELQIERGLSSSYLNNTNPHFEYLLQKQKKESDIELNNFLTFLSSIKNFPSISNQLLIDDINSMIRSLSDVREKVSNSEMTAKESFNYFTKLNSTLIELSQDITLYSADKTIYDKIMILKKLLQFREYAGQERALVADLIKKSISKDDIYQFNNLLDGQSREFKKIRNLLKNTDFSERLDMITESYKDSYVHKTRKLIRLGANLKKDIDPELWITAATKKIDNYYLLEYSIFLEIQNYTQKQADRIEFSLISQVIVTILTIFLLLLGAYLISRKINRSLENLDSGLNDFFDFLDFKTETPVVIDAKSNNELDKMAKKINNQIKHLQLNLENDRDFIHETTQIVMMMRDGDFSEKPYFEPSNPNLMQLKLVLNELIELISDKIKEQTESLETLNSSLEDRVHFQTLELEEQIKEITISRDKAIQAEIAKDEFLANMSHEIRTPLNAILGFVTILKKQIKDEKPLKYLDIIDTSGKSLLTIINDILDFSKIQSGKFTITANSFYPLDEFSNATLLFASKSYEKHILYSVYIDPNLPQTISVDSVRVKQILSNIISNAIKFTPEDGEIKVSVKVENSDLVISVEDTGIGISPKNQTKIFSAFEQADGSTTRKYGGTGLGLSISSKLAALMNGTLTLKSAESAGSIFTMSIPIEIVESTHKELINRDKMSAIKFAILSNKNSCYSSIKLLKKYLEDFGATNILELNEFSETAIYDILFFIPEDEYNEDIVNSSRPAIAMLRTSTIKLANLEHISALYAPFVPKAIVEAIDDIKIDHLKTIEQKPEVIIEDEDEQETQFDAKVLVAEDNKTNQMLISLILDDFGIEYAIANDGLEAIDMFKDAKYDLVLMDENMPNLNGIGAMQAIKKYEEKNSLIFTPIVALTASVLDSDKEMFMDAGMDGFVGKPIDTSELESELSRFLKKA